MSDPFTIRIFVPDGDPEGVRLIDRMNWTGVGIAFPRTHLAPVRNRSELAGAGVYVLVGYSDADDDLPTVYVGQADHVGRRLEQHDADKEFWDWGIAFVSTGDGLNVTGRSRPPYRSANWRCKLCGGLGQRRFDGR